jgi:hypothetical protein
MEKEQLNEVLERLREVTVLANKSLLAISDGIKYDPNIHKWSGTIRFPEDSFIAYKGMSVTESGGTYWLKFSAFGELKSALESAKLPSKFCTLLMNERFRSYIDIQAGDDLNRLFFGSVFFTLHSKGEFDIHSVDENEANKALLKIEKLLLIPRIKYA